MWLIVQNNTVEIVSNDPSHDIIRSLQSRAPGAKIYRSLHPCINRVNDLIFAVKEELGEIIEIDEPLIDEDGQPVLDDQGLPVTRTYQTREASTFSPAGNTYRLESDYFIIETSEGAEIERFEVEVQE